jgi:hypothetical protein
VAQVAGDYLIDRRYLEHNLSIDTQEMDKYFLQRLVHHRITERRLPLGRAVGIHQMWGDGRPCDACEEPLSPNERAVMAMVPLEWMSVHLHVNCYELWDAERSALFGEIGGRGESTQIM